LIRDEVARQNSPRSSLKRSATATNNTFVA
jgi:hypothetical protein